VVEGGTHGARLQPAGGAARLQVIHLHLACATPNLKVVEYLSQTEEGDRIWYTEFPEPRDGMWSPYPDRPGLGLALDPTAVRLYSVYRGRSPAAS
jgi:L-alanine-DL-glutamate epimerase-like enolase superfamily enzyme